MPDALPIEGAWTITDYVVGGTPTVIEGLLLFADGRWTTLFFVGAIDQSPWASGEGGEYQREEDRLVFTHRYTFQGAGGRPLTVNPRNERVEPCRIGIDRSDADHPLSERQRAPLPTRPMTSPVSRDPAEPPRLAREMGLLGLVSTALCAMIGVGINIIPFMIQRSRPGIADIVPLAFIVAAVPASMAALCYAILSSAMPRAGGSYIYATRGLEPFLGFLASFAQWFGLSMGMGVVAYLFVPMLRDTVATAGWPELAPVFDRGEVRVPLALAAIWLFWWINRRGIKDYERTVVLMTFGMLAGPLIMTVAGFLNDPADFFRALEAQRNPQPDPSVPAPAPNIGALRRRRGGALLVLHRLRRDLPGRRRGEERLEEPAALDRGRHRGRHALLHRLHRCRLSRRALGLHLPRIAGPRRVRAGAPDAAPAGVAERDHSPGGDHSDPELDSVGDACQLAHALRLRRGSRLSGDPRQGPPRLPDAAPCDHADGDLRAACPCSAVTSPAISSSVSICWCCRCS